ncbi:Hypothetical protein TFLO_1889 [Trichococcus flocculiformis]|uniref:Uncharacterized protein n=1 Tax=Trichococcus flocculiformis TaxID=82803 RepID=A0ABP2CHE6_9LACT|nr:Hypothetical protein TFLO_1889 [Trichococcus flocculiformis]
MDVGCPPANEGSAEVRIPSRACSGEANLNGSWCSTPARGLLDGVGLFGIRLPPVRECLPELSMRMQAGLQRTRARRRYGSPSRACSGEANLNGSWCSPPARGLLDGVGLFGIRLPPVRECLPELSMRMQAVLRRTRVRRRYGSPSRASSGEANLNGSWCSPPARGLLDGVALFGIRLPPVRECLPELSMRMQAVLRRTRARRRYGLRARACSGEANLNGSWCSPPARGFSTELGSSVFVFLL